RPYPTSNDERRRVWNGPAARPARRFCHRSGDGKLCQRAELSRPNVSGLRSLAAAVRRLAAARTPPQTGGLGHEMALAAIAPLRRGRLAPNWRPLNRASADLRQQFVATCRLAWTPPRDAMQSLKSRLSRALLDSNPGRQAREASEASSRDFASRGGGIAPSKTHQAGLLNARPCLEAPMTERWPRPAGALDFKTDQRGRERAGFRQAGRRSAAKPNWKRTSMLPHWLSAQACSRGRRDRARHSRRRVAIWMGNRDEARPPQLRRASRKRRAGARRLANLRANWKRPNLSAMQSQAEVGELKKLHCRMPRRQIAAAQHCAGSQFGLCRSASREAALGRKAALSGRLPHAAESGCNDEELRQLSAALSEAEAARPDRLEAELASAAKRNWRGRGPAAAGSWRPLWGCIEPRQPKIWLKLALTLTPKRPSCPCRAASAKRARADRLERRSWPMAQNWPHPELRALHELNWSAPKAATPRRFRSGSGHTRVPAASVRLTICGAAENQLLDALASRGQLQEQLESALGNAGRLAGELAPGYRFSKALDERKTPQLLGRRAGSVAKQREIAGADALAGLQRVLESTERQNPRPPSRAETARRDRLDALGRLVAQPARSSEVGAIDRQPAVLPLRMGRGAASADDGRNRLGRLGASEAEEQAERLKEACGKADDALQSGRRRCR
uniref:WH2 domain-containing protein n=1 Tax=Macrostomum lignano TaxID=282301 RepID=A0A1I8FFF4_9PLAT